MFLRPGLPGLFCLLLGILRSDAQSISGFSPQLGPPGTVVTIFGSNLGNTTAAYFGSFEAPAVINSVSASQVVVTVPANALTGQLSLTVNTFSVSSSGIFYAAPRITSFTPRAAVGQQVQIDGFNFNPGAVTVKFGSGTSASGTASSAQTVFVNVPSGAVSGPLTLTVNLSGNLLTTLTAANFAVSDGSPVITGFSPTSGLTGTRIAIEGGDFTGATAVQFNGTNAAFFQVTAATQVHADVQSGASTGPIKVITPRGTATSSSNFVVSGAPIVTGFSPGGGPVGATVVVNGSRFLGTTSVWFNTTSTTAFTLTADTQLQVTVPTGATTGPITVYNPHGAGSTFGTGLGDFIVGSGPTITNFNPVGGPAGTQVTIQGLFFNNITAVRFNGSNASYTLTGVGSELVATVPAEAGTGPISIETATGTNTTSSNFLFGSAPVISGFSPAHGQTNTVVTISGDNFFAGHTRVKFNGLTSSNASVLASTQISAPVPFGASTGPLTIETPLGTNTTGTNFFVTPAITGFSPTNGGAGLNVTVTGSNFVGAASVWFNGAAASFTVLSNAALLAQVPSNALTGPISIATPAGIITTTSNFFIVPRIFGFAPSLAPVGASVVITGAAFGNVSSVEFNGVPSTGGSVDSLSQITAVVPATAVSGPIRITTADGVAVSPSNFVVRPAITSFSPVSGSGGTEVTIDGTTLGGVTNVQFNGLNATSFQIVNPTRLKAIVAAGTSTGPITVITADATNSSVQSFTVGSDIAGFSPASAPPGATVRITGIGLDQVTGVQFNGASATTLTPVSASELDAVVPFTATKGPVKIVSNSGSSQTSSNFTVLPAIAGMVPDSGGFAEETIILGGGFESVTGVQINGIEAVFNVQSSIAIQAFVPAPATTGPVRVTTMAGTALSGANFTVIPPTILSLDPVTAPVGAQITIHGRSLAGATNVTFNGVSAIFITNSFTQLTATVPASASFGPVRVFTPAGTALSGDSFGVRPVITGFTPSNGAIGSLVTISGNGFLGATNVQFSGVNSQSFTVDGAGQISARVPSVASPGRIRVQSPGGQGESATDFDPLLLTVHGFSPVEGGASTQVVISGTHLEGVTNVQFNAVNAFINSLTPQQIVVTVPLAATTGPVTVRAPGDFYTTGSNFTVRPVITGFSPVAANAGTVVTITGTLLTGATQVKFGAGNATQFTVDSATQIRATVPTGGTSGPLQVIAPAGTATSSSTFDVLPELVSFTPGSGPVGTAVDITGINIGAATSVLFNGLPAAYTNHSSTCLTAVVPDDATSGPLRVVTSQGQVEAAQSFLVTPRIDAFSPRGGLAGDRVLLIGSAFTGATNILFSTNVSALSFVISNYHVISVTVPDGATNGPVTVQTPSGEGASGFDFPVGAVLLAGATNATQFAIAWSTNATNYALEFTTDLTPPITWQPVATSPTVEGGQNKVVIDYSNPPRYFRLRK